MSASNQTPEQRARDQIDLHADWTVQDKNTLNLNVGCGQAEAMNRELAV